MATTRICSIPDCGKPLAARGWCLAHYKRWRKHGETGSAPIRGTKGTGPLDWLEGAARARTDDCVLWPFAISERGYGKVRSNGQTRRAHRMVCKIAHGAPPMSDAQAAHKCGNRLCCNPQHLYWATPSENQMDRADHGTSNRGKRQWKATLSEGQVLQICALLDEGRGRTSIGQDFGVSRSAIRAIDIGANWGWLTGRGST